MKNLWEKYKRYQGYIWGAMFALLGALTIYNGDAWYWSAVDFGLAALFLWLYQCPRGWFSQQRLAKLHEPAPVTFEEGMVAVLNDNTPGETMWDKHLKTCTECREFWGDDRP